MAVTSKSVPTGTGKAAKKIVQPLRPAPAKTLSNKTRRDVRPAKAGSPGYRTR